MTTSLRVKTDNVLYLSSPQSWLRRLRFNVLNTTQWKHLKSQLYFVEICEISLLF